MEREKTLKRKCILILNKFLLINKWVVLLWIKVCDPWHLSVFREIDGKPLAQAWEGCCWRDCFERGSWAVRWGSYFRVLFLWQPSTLLELSACYPLLTLPQTHGCVYECFCWKQLLHKLFDRILASGILCTIIFWRKLSLSSFNNCFICCFLCHN